MIASVAGLLLVFAGGGLLALRGLANRGMDAASPDASSPVVVADTRTVPQTQSAPSVPAPTLVRVSKPAPEKKQEPPQRLTVSEESAATTAVEDVGGMRDALTVGHIEEHPRMVEAEAAPVATPVPEGGALAVDGVDAIEVRRSQPPTAVQDLSEAPAHSADTLVRLAFATRAEDAAGTPDKSIDAPMVGSVGKAPVQSYVGQPVTARAIDDTMKRTDLPKPTTLANAHVPEAPQAPHSPTSVVDYLSMPNKSSDWIKGFIKDYYLSGAALEDADLRRIYSHRVEYFGKHKTSIDEVAREQARYYREWPNRHYELVPGSIAIKWKADKVADVSFTYRYEVSASDKRTSKGRGRAHLTLDLHGHTGLITREDGEVIAHK